VASTAPRETQEMVFDAHDRAFALFKGTCVRGIYDNMKTAVETIFVGKGRLFVGSGDINLHLFWLPLSTARGQQRPFHCRTLVYLNL
jgi:hypothetical protein